MPWPQYFDGKYWQNELAVRYAIHSIPAMFLLDQDGRVVSTNARGEKLETEVKRLLKLQPLVPPTSGAARSRRSCCAPAAPRCRV